MAQYDIITKNDFSPLEIASFIDHSLLFANTTMQELEQFVQDCKTYSFGGGCVNSVNLEYVAKALQGSVTRPCVTIGYPWGTVPVEIKVREIEYVLDKGAMDYDCVIHVGAVKSEAFDAVRRELDAMVEPRKHFPDVGNKLIIESCYLTDEEKIKVCQMAKEAGFDYVKTSTGFGKNSDGTPGFCTIHDVQLMKQTVGNDMRVKASGGCITNYDIAVEFLNAGAHRLGTRAGVEVVKSASKR